MYSRSQGFKWQSWARNRGVRHLSLLAVFSPQRLHFHADIYIMRVLTYVLREIVEIVWEQFTEERAVLHSAVPRPLPPPPSNSWLRRAVLPLKMTLLSLSQQGLHFMHILV